MKRNHQQIHTLTYNTRNAYANECCDLTDSLLPIVYCIVIRCYIIACYRSFCQIFSDNGRSRRQTQALRL